MARIEKEFFVDVSERTTFENIFAKQFDCKSRFLKVTLTNRGEKLSIDQNSTVTINSLRRDGKASSFLGIVNAEGTVTVPITSWMLEKRGDIKCDISVVDEDGGKLTSMAFIINVEKAACSDAGIMEDDDPSLLAKLLEGLRILNNTRVWKKEISNKGVVTIFAESGSPLEISCKVVTQETLPESGDKSADNPSTFLGLNSITVTVGDKNYTFSLPSTAWGLPGFEDVVDLNSGQLIHNTGHIPGYNGEEIGDVYLSSTGGLDIGAEVVYPLAEPTTEPITGIEKIYSVTHADKYIPEPTAVTCECAELTVGYAANLNALIGNGAPKIPEHITNYIEAPALIMNPEDYINSEYADSGIEVEEVMTVSEMEVE